MNRFHLILFFCFLPSVTLSGVEYICPTFKEGVNTAVCKINKTAATDSTKCISQQNNVTFDWTLNYGITLCYAPTPSSSACKTQNDPSPNTCWCDGSDQDIFTYKFTFVANLSRDLGALLECKFCEPLMENTNMEAIAGCKIANIESSAHWIHSILAQTVAIFSSGVVLYGGFSKVAS